MENRGVAVVRRRWVKWLQPEERGSHFSDLKAERRSWLVETGARYVWARPEILVARRRLYDNLWPAMRDPHQVVIERVVRAIERYFVAFNLSGSLPLFADALASG